MSDSTGSIFLDDMNFGTSKIVPQFSQSGDVVLVKHLFLETLSIDLIQGILSSNLYVPKEKYPNGFFMGQHILPGTPAGQSLPAKNQSFLA